jgi:DNA-binding beta-propeller fold protein YncE
MMPLLPRLRYLTVLPLLLAACVDHPFPPVEEKPDTFKEVASIDLGGEASAEIGAYDPISKRLFVVNNESKALVDVIDLSNFPTLTKLAPIDVSALGGVANSVATSGGKLAIALEATDKQAAGKVLVYDAGTLTKLKEITVGALPDMVTYSPDGRYLVTADEGEPNATYTNDPDGSISIIDIQNNYSVKTIKFDGIAGQLPTLTAGGFRLFGPSAGTPAKDIEPEYVSITPDSKKAFVTLQENNGIAEVDLGTGTLLRIIPLGTKDYSKPENAFDPTNTGNTISFVTAPVKSFYLPDALAYFTIGGTGYLLTADEGDAREYDPGYIEQVRIGDASVKLDPAVFPNAATLKINASLGRLNITKSAGNLDSDDEFEELYAFGGRGFSILNAATGQRVYETGRTLEDKVVAAGLYDDGRSDDKGIEPEGVTIGYLNGKSLAFVALERADAIAVYDVSTPTAPVFLQLFKTGDAPEGVHFVPAAQSPNGRSLLIVSSEGDGTVKLYQPEK